MLVHPICYCQFIKIWKYLWKSNISCPNQNLWYEFDKQIKCNLMHRSKGSHKLIELIYYFHKKENCVISLFLKYLEKRIEHYKRWFVVIISALSIYTKSLDG